MRSVLLDGFISGYQSLLGYCLSSPAIMIFTFRPTLGLLAMPWQSTSTVETFSACRGAVPGQYRIEALKMSRGFDKIRLPATTQIFAEATRKTRRACRTSRSIG